MCDNVALALIFFFFLIIFPLPLKLPDLNGNSNPALSCRPGGRADGRGQEGTMETRGKAPRSPAQPAGQRCPWRGLGKGRELGTQLCPQNSSDGQRYHFQLVSAALICPAPNMAGWKKNSQLNLSLMQRAYNCN